MHDHFTLLYVIFGMVFGVLAVSVLPHYQGAAGRIPSYHLLSAMVLAACACLAYAAAPFNLYFGALANALGFASFYCAALLCRSLNRPLPHSLGVWSVFGVSLALVLFVKIQVLDSFVARAALTFAVLNGLSLWQWCELWAYRRSHRSLQLHLALVFIGVQLVLSSVRIYLLFNSAHVGYALASEPDTIATLRWIWFAMDIGLLICMAGVILDKLSKTNVLTVQENERIQALKTQLEGHLAEKNKMLEALIFSSKSSNVGLLLSNLTHEIAQPLSAMRLVTEIVLQDTQMTRDAKERALHKVLQEIDRTVDIVHKSRQFFTGQARPSGPFDVRVLILETLRFFQQDLIKFNIQVKPELTEGLMLQANRAQVESALLYLIGHLIDSVKTVNHPKEVSISMRCHDNQVILNLSNNAQVLPAAMRDAFFEINCPSSMAFPEFGLWLARSIVEFHSGAVAVLPSNSGRHIQLALPAFHS